MGSTFDVDGKIVRNPSGEDIQKGFASIDAEGPRSLSIIQMQRAKKTLCAFGHPKEGYTLDCREEIGTDGAETSKVTSPAKTIPHEEVIQIFQAFANGNESWQDNYQWEPGLNRLSNRRGITRLAALFLILALLILLMKFVRKLF